MIPYTHTRIHTNIHTYTHSKLEFSKLFCFKKRNFRFPLFLIYNKILVPRDFKLERISGSTTQIRRQKQLKGAFY